MNIDPARLCLKLTVLADASTGSAQGTSVRGEVSNHDGMYRTTTDVSTPATLRYLRASGLQTSLSRIKKYVMCFALILAGCGGSSTPPVTLSSVAISPYSVYIEVGVSYSLTATGTYADGTTADLTSQVAWSSADTGTVAMITTPGVVTGVAVGIGPTKITASLNGVISAATVTVVSGAQTDLHMARLDHTATLLADGNVLVVGGYGNALVPTPLDALDSAELYDKITGKWKVNTLGLAIGRGDHTATLLVNPSCLALTNCKVLVAGGVDPAGNDVPSAELYDPSFGTWSAAGSLVMPRSYHTVTLLADGTVLMVGGVNNGTATINGLGTIPDAEAYDPARGNWKATGSLAMKRSSHTATLLNDGTVLVVGGFYVDATSPGGVALDTAELYVPSSRTWTATGSLGVGGARSNHTATLFTSGPNAGKVLVVGGADAAGNELSSAEIYDPIFGTWTGVAPLIAPRYNHTATLLNSGPNAGKVLVVGGSVAGTSIPLTTAELYDPISNTWSSTSITGRVTHTVTLLGNSGLNANKVLVAGGDGVAGVALSSVELLSY